MAGGGVVLAGGVLTDVCEDGEAGVDGGYDTGSDDECAGDDGAGLGGWCTAGVDVGGGVSALSLAQPARARASTTTVVNRCTLVKPRTALMA
ncbi:hypothetical protein [Aestuariimicrobium ganziense]|uniref:hypothetical protein n=1 Tax=Aestuariimicrobium ganziense TaxID=2773677 RepID=UPI001944E5BC|nr:hypothetical protein [Aestuariimicrobium ganziense]